ncbi:Ppx/GppA phosphatase family protein [Tengunoibacter tsumagoiensis]|uniref:CHAD domain-containing protein n=1 Tax=Tengunoibacter tsumagoiensis TaxID=2014871 RepID=A0A401ZXG4_9CHLR|nr:CHAD domain-containing protein [Tengunoibacter tsumagoiensis]GCE11548.1 hypothetical protein KTT_14070 [Tengunoibacter tsumagoiensis]
MHINNVPPGEVQEQPALSQPVNEVAAGIDIGSNTLRVVVARCCSEQIEILAVDERLVRIGESVNATGAISGEKQELTIATLQQFRALGEKYGATRIFAVATEAIRKASNREAFLAAIQQETGIEVQLIEGEVEATITFYGATYALPQREEQPERIGVMDLGGGSTELVLARELQIIWHTSLPVGSGVIHDRYLTNDPPTSEDLTAARTFLANFFQDIKQKDAPPILLATGGSANVVHLLAQRAFGHPEDQLALTHEDLVRCEGLLCALPAEEIAKRYQIEPKRARILLAGVLIMVAVLERFQLEQIEVSSYGIREGVLLAYARYGEQWLAQVQQRAEQVSQQLEKQTEEGGREGETFAEAGRRVILDRTEKMLEWRDAVIESEEIEAVHKMRVASRRLRAALDAYEAICKPKEFKKVYRQVKILAGNLGLARDTDVMILNMQSRLAEADPVEQAGLDWFIEHLKAERQRYQKKLSCFLSALDHHELRRQIEEKLFLKEDQHG